MSYWDILTDATERLEQGRFPEAESRFEEARYERDQSPGRVFFTEKVGDGIKRLVGGFRSHDDAQRDNVQGRWAGEARDFEQSFKQQGEVCVREALRLADLLPEEDSDGQLKTLTAALYLMTRSRIFPEDLNSAVPVVKAAFRVAPRLGRLFDVEFVRHDLPLTEEDRIWLSERGDALLATFAEQDDRDEVHSRDWARALIRLIDPSCFAPRSRFNEDRSWLEACLCDRHLGDPEAAVTLYRAFLDQTGETSDRSALARVRLLELLANVDAAHFPVPRYDEALQEVGAGSATGGRDVADRQAFALGVIGWRRPQEPPNRAWASVCGDGAGGLTFVSWWQDEPRDLAHWSEGEDLKRLQTFLAPCNDRLVWLDSDTGDVVADLLEEDDRGRSILPFCECLLEAQLPEGGLNPAALAKISLSSTAAWRSGWDRRRGHASLQPRRPGDGQTPRRDEDVNEALDAGLVWLACRARVYASTPAVLAGIRELSRRGDPAAAFLEDFVDLGLVVDTVIETAEWILPDLLERDDPLAGLSLPDHGEEEDGGPRPDLVGNRVAVVSSGRPGAVLGAWGATSRRLRVVLDHARRLGVVASAARGGLVTLVPPGGRVHHLGRAMEFVDELLLGTVGHEGTRNELLPLLHVLRLAESHNGDLLDYRFLRPRRPGVLPLHDLYVDAIVGLRTSPVTEDSATDSWAIQYRVRARRSQLLVGECSDITDSSDELDARWGVSRGGDAAWVFLDSAAVHWRLKREGGPDIAELHRELADRGREHLSLVLGGTFLREDLESLLATWLEPYGSPYCLALTDVRPPLLHLAAGGIAPDAKVLALPAALSQWEYIDTLLENGENPAVLMPSACGLRDLWSRWSEGAGSLPVLETAELWSSAPAGDTAGSTRLVVPVLESLGACEDTPAQQKTRSDWARADLRRRQRLRGERLDCALEINALLSCRVAAVDIADPRWWRRFAFDGVSVPTSGHTAAALVTENAGLAYDLPEAAWAMEDERAVETRDWMRRQGWIREDGFGYPPGRMRPPADWHSGEDPGNGVRLHVGDGRAAWFATALWFCENRERGRLDCRLGLMGPEAPEGASDILAAYPCGGVTVPESAPDPEAVCGPLFWLDMESPEEDEALSWLDRIRPQALFGGDLRRWLPAASRPALAEAGLLRRLARGGIARIDLYAGAMAPAWRLLLERFWASSGRDDALKILADPCISQSGYTMDLVSSPAVSMPCIACGAPVSRTASWAACPQCGVDAVRWLSDDTAAALKRRSLLADLQKVRDMSREEGPQLWRLFFREEDFARVPALLRALGIPTCTEGDRLMAEPGNDAAWLLAPDTTLARTPMEEKCVLFFPPTRQEADLLARVSSRVLLAFHASDISPVSERNTSPGTGVFLKLLAGIQEWLPRMADQSAEVDTRQEDLIPVSLPGYLTGLDRPRLLTELNALRWVAVLGGRELPGMRGSAGSDCLLLKWPFAEIEYRLRQTVSALESLLPLLLSGTPAGVPIVCDLASLPARIPAESLLWLDRFLMTASLRLSPAAEIVAEAAANGEPNGGGDEIYYRPVDGILSANLRRIGYLGTVPGVISRLRHHLDLFLASVQMILARAEATDDGYRVALGRSASGLDEEDVIELGILLGVWHRQGPPSAEFLLVGDLVALAEAAEVGGRERCLRLLDDLAEDDHRWRLRLMEAIESERLEWGRARSEVVPATTKLEKKQEDAAGRILAAATAGGPGVLVLRGQAGTGRLEALTAGLKRALRAGVSGHSLVFYCPDVATAARLRRRLKASDTQGHPDIRVAGADALPPAATPSLMLGADPAAAVSVLVEAQRMPVELRYRIAQHVRQGVQIVLVDMAEAEDSWENLLLTMPRPEDVVQMRGSTRHAKKIWHEIRALSGLEGADKIPTKSREKGSCRSKWAANLDECLAAIESEASANRLGDGMLLVAPMPEDLAYLGRSLGQGGWLPVYRQELDSLLLPGALEFVAAVSDCGIGESSFLSPLLDAQKRASWEAWRDRMPDVGGESLRDFLAAIMRTDWASPFLEKQANRTRIEDLLNDLGSETLSRFLDRPLWEAWRREVCDLVGIPRGRCASPVVALTTPDQAPAAMVRSGVYLCLGSEPRQQHYRVLSRMTDSLVVLFREKSPLPSEHDD